MQNFSADDMRQAQVEVLLVTPTRAIAKLLTQQINACGFRVNAVNDPVDGLTAALCARPDMIITSQEMRTMSGVDLLCAVRAISAVAKTPAALLTSKSSDRAAFPGLPEDVMLLRMGDAFTDDFAGAIAQFGIGESGTTQRIRRVSVRHPGLAPGSTVPLHERMIISFGPCEGRMDPGARPG